MSAPIRLAAPHRVCLLPACLLILSAGSAAATDLAAQKLYGRWVSTPTNFHLGEESGSSALTETYAVVGASRAQDRGTASEGAVQVFRADTGAWVRRIHAPGTVATRSFGFSVAAVGATGLIGATSVDNKGAAYLVNLASGSVLRTLLAPDGAFGDSLGASVALTATHAIVGASGDDGFRGSVYVFRLSNGEFLYKLQAVDGVAGDLFGRALAAEGTILAVGAPYHNGERGAIYFFDLETGSEIRKVLPAAAGVGDRAGFALAMHGGRVAVGCRDARKALLYDLAADAERTLLPGWVPSVSFGNAVAIHGPLVAVGEPGGDGAVHLFRSSDGSYWQSLNPPFGDVTAASFGSSVALHGPVLLGAASSDRTQATGAGAAYLVRPLTQPMAFTKVAAEGEFVPGRVDVGFKRLGDVFINAGGETLIETSLAGDGSGRGRDTAAVSDVALVNRLQLLMQSRSLLGGATVGVVSKLSMNDLDLAVGGATLTGPGLGRGGNQMVWYATGTTAGELLRSGSPVAEFGGANLRAVPEFVTSNRAGLRQFAAVCTLKPEAATGVTAANDSGLWFAQVLAATGSEREGDAAPATLPGGTLLGQFAPRVCYFYERMVFSCGLSGPGITPADNAAIFRRPFGGASALVARRNDAAVDGTGAAIPGVAYSTFLGEGSTGSHAAFYRATLAGAPAGENEGLWRLDADGVTRRLFLRKGQVVIGPAGTRLGGIRAFWPTGNASAPDQIVVLAQLAGTGVNGANDLALLLVQADRSVRVLLREGESAPGCGSGRIRTIQRVEVDGWNGSYAVLASLSGVPRTSDQAIFTGNVNRGDLANQSPLRRPFLRLRKGDLYDNQPGRVRSIALPAGNLPSSGAGGNGRGRAISWDGDFALVVEFDNKVRQSMKGRSD